MTSHFSTLSPSFSILIYVAIDRCIFNFWAAVNHCLALLDHCFKCIFHSFCCYNIVHFCLLYTKKEKKCSPIPLTKVSHPPLLFPFLQGEGAVLLHIGKRTSLPLIWPVWDTSLYTGSSAWMPPPRHLRSVYFLLNYHPLPPRWTRIVLVLILQNRPFLSSPGPLFQNEVKWSAFDMEIIFHSHANKIVHLASFWKWGFLELGSAEVAYWFG